MRKYWKSKCLNCPKEVQEMADNCHILDHDVIEVCMETCITFKPEFLEELGYKQPEFK